MNTEWRSLCGAKGLSVESACINVDLDNGRRQRVEVEERDTHLILRSIVGRRALFDAHPDLMLNCWKRNRHLELMGFRADLRGRLIGEACVPKAGLTADEFQLYVKTLAGECDRFEYQLTGGDDR